jgi:hypothetical protein
VRPPFPIDRWGTVTGQPFQRICIVRCEPSSFLVLIQKDGNHFDDWCESEEDVAHYLEDIDVVWES